VLVDDETLRLNFGENVSFGMENHRPQARIRFDAPLLPPFDDCPHATVSREGEVAGDARLVQGAHTNRARETRARFGARFAEPNPGEANGHGHALRLVARHHPVAEELPGVVEKRPSRAAGFDRAADAAWSENADVDDSLECGTVEKPMLVVDRARVDGGRARVD